MELNDFVEKFSEQFDETERSVFKPDTVFKQLDEWSSMTALSVIDMEQLKCMASCGMHIGSHGYNHYWLSSLTKEAQREEIVRSIDFIKEIGSDVNQWTICYPYGSYNQDTISLLKEYHCNLGFTTRVNIATVDEVGDSKFTIPILDTNDLPKNQSALTDDWFRKAD